MKFALYKHIKLLEIQHTNLFPPTNQIRFSNFLIPGEAHVHNLNSPTDIKNHYNNKK